MPNLFPPTFLISWLKQVQTRKSDVRQKSLRKHNALQCFQPSPKSLIYRNFLQTQDHKLFHCDGETRGLSLQKV